MSEILRSFTLYIELITAITGSIFYYKYKNTYLKYFLFLLWYIVLNEFLGFYTRVYLEMNNSRIYNIYYIINFTFLLSIYKHFLQKKLFKTCVKIFIIVYWSTCIINAFYENFLEVAQIVPYIIVSSFLIISILLYFVEILQSERILNINKELLFWISIGLLLFHIGYIPYKIVQKFYDSIASANLENLRSLFFSLILILNICYITGFIWRQPSQKHER